MIVALAVYALVLAPVVLGVLLVKRVWADLDRLPGPESPRD